MPRDLPGLEILEPRCLLSTAFASVGLGWGEQGGVLDADIISTEGSLADALTVGGSLYVEEETGRERRDDLWYDSVVWFEDGRFDRDPPEGFLGVPRERNGARFVASDGYPVGWWLSEYASGFEDAEILLTTNTDAALVDFEGTYQFTTIAFDTVAREFFISNGQLTIGEDDVRWSAIRGTPHRVTSDILGLGTFGQLLTDREEHVYLSADGLTIAYADMSTADGITAVGFGTRIEAVPEASTLPGVYLTLHTFESNGRVNFRQVALELEDDGDYKFFDLDEYDDGNADPFERGFWRVSGSDIVLAQDDTDNEHRFRISENGSTLIGTEFDAVSARFPVFALGTRVTVEEPPPPEPEVVFSVPGRDEVDRPLVFQLESDDAWYVVDVIATIGGPVPIGEIVTWVDARDGLSYAAAVTSLGLILYTEGDDDSWSYRNLTSEVFGGQNPAGELGLMIAPSGIVHLTALAADGDVLHYWQNGAQGDDGEWRWTFENISEEDLDAAGVDTPEFDGLVSYATSWNGLNVVGLDDSGEIWGVWWAPGQPRWNVSNLTSAYGAEPLVGGLSVYLTPWNGINIAGIDGDGHLQVTWWVPRFRGQWAQTDLTESSGSPLYEPASLGSFVSSWGGLNLVGADRTTGEVVVTWWSPGRGDLGWAVTSLSDQVPQGAPVIEAPYTGVAARDASLNVFGYASTDFVRYYWEPGFGGSWQVQNLTDIAVER